MRVLPGPYRWGCKHGGEVPGNRPLQLCSLPIPHSHPTTATPLRKGCVETIKITQFLADFAIASTKQIPWARISSNGRSRGVAALATRFPCPFIPSASWGRSLEEVVPRLLHQGREVAKDHRWWGASGNVPSSLKQLLRVAMAAGLLAHQTMNEGDQPWLKGCQGACWCQRSSRSVLRGRHSCESSPFLWYPEG